MGVESLSSASLLSSGRHDALLWNLVHFFYRVGLPTHLLDAYPAWLMDCQAELRRLGPGGKRCLKGSTMTKALSVSHFPLRHMPLQFILASGRLILIVFRPFPGYQALPGSTGLAGSQVGHVSTEGSTGTASLSSLGPTGWQW